ncbi:MAG: regulatory protein RecX [Chloroflexi bacterium]|nr:regulatory protein RecX [Chloroflexota bacterium]
MGKDKKHTGESAGENSVATGSESLRRCLEVAIRFLGYRARSEREMRTRLQRGGFDAAVIEAVISRLKEQGLVDDLAFARSWTEDRRTLSPRSRRLVRSELKQKGIADQTIDGITGELDDDMSAYEVAASKARLLPPDDFAVFRKKIGGYLERRGFSYEVIERAVARAWREQNSK